MFETASASTATKAFAPTPKDSGLRPSFLASGLVEEAAALQQPRAFLGRDLDVARRQQKYLVGHPLHPPVERVREAAREVDQPLRQLLVGALEVEDHRDRILELVGDLLRVVEASREDEM